MRSLYILCVIFSFTIPLAFGQNCGLNGPLDIPPNDTASYTFEVFDVVDSNLASPGQGVCAIEITFLHNKLTDLEMWLVSPGGDTVQLIGPNATDGSNTLLGRWDVTFLPSSQLASPDVPFQAQWDNEVNDFPPNDYNGSYYPFRGRLEDFNSGNTNGGWNLIVATNPTNVIIPGRISDFRIVFCNDLGQNCCFANAGLIREDTIFACADDDSLRLAPQPDFVFGTAPDTTAYDFLYAFSQNGILVDYVDTVDLRSFPAATYDICGLSFRSTERDSLPVPDGALRLDALRDTLLAPAAPFCGNISDECQTVVVAPVPDTVRIDTTLCPGESIFIGGTAIDTAGTTRLTLQTIAGCDSVVVVNINFFPPNITTIDTTLCAGESILVAGNTYDASGFYTDTLVSANGCDSIINLDLTVRDILSGSDTRTICAGDSLFIGTDTLTTAGSYLVVLQSVTGCDSLLALNLVAIETQAIIDPADPIDCNNPSVVLDGQNSTTNAATFNYEWRDPGGNIIGNDPTQTVTAAGVYTLTLIGERNGVICSSTVSTSVAANLTPPEVVITSPEVITCDRPQITLDGSGSDQGPNISYVWTTTDGTIIGPTNALTANVEAAGTYQLAATNNLNGCVGTAEVVVDADNVLPVVDAGPPDTLNCADTVLTLDGSGSLQGAAVSYLWTSPVGNPIINPASLNPVVRLPGLYRLEVRNTDNGCVNTDDVAIAEDFQVPVVNIADPPMISCGQPLVILDASASSIGSAFSYRWNVAAGGSIVSGGDSLTPIVNAGGFYELVIANENNFCQDSAFVIVLDTFNTVVANAGPTDTLNCRDSVLLLSAAGSTSGPDIVYDWFTLNGNIVQESGTGDITVDQPGIYTLAVLDTFTGCADTSSVLIRQNLQTPVADAGPDLELTCTDPIVALDGFGSSQGPDYSYLWLGGCVNGSRAQITVDATCADIYRLLVTNERNGCTAQDSMVLDLSSINPVATIQGDTIAINCNSGSALLDATGSGGGQLLWFFEGNPISNNTTVTVNEPGSYLLTVTNTMLGCADSARVEVVLDCDPQIILADVDTLTCLRPSIQLDASASLAGTQTTFRWSGPAPGCIINGENSAQPRVACGGNYRLVLTNLAVGLFDTLTVFVPADTVVPNVTIADPDTLNCQVEEVMLDGMGSDSGPNIEYRWIDFSGDTLGTDPTLIVDESGIYALEAIDLSNGCIGTDFVVVPQDPAIPAIQFPGNVYPCNQDSFLLVVDLTPPGNYTYQWSGDSILQVTDSTAIWIGGPGTYRLSVENLDNGCIASDSVTLREQACGPCLEADTVLPITCDRPEVQLTVRLCAACAGCTYNWTTTDGNIVNGASTLTPLVNQPGRYRLLAIDEDGRRTELSLQVPDLTSPPGLSAGPDQLLNCVVEEVRLGDPGVSPDSALLFQWTDANGNLIPGADVYRPVVTEPGSYRLAVTNTLTGCTAADEIVVRTNFSIPFADAGPDGNLTCEASLVRLDGSASSRGDTIGYQWTALGTNFLQSGSNTINPLVNGPGSYVLTVRNLLSGCTATDTVTVTTDSELPVFEALPDTNLTCAIDQINLTANWSQQPGLIPEWCALDENDQPVNCTTGEAITITQAGAYRFQLVNDQSGCANQQIINVELDTVTPVVEAGADQILDCTDASVDLSGQLLFGADPDLSIAWTSEAGATIPFAGDNPLAVTVFNGGRYLLTVSNERNGCTGVDSVRVTEDDQRPFVDAGPDTSINCLSDVLRLQGSAIGSTMNGALGYQWRSGNSGGQVLEDADQLRPFVRGPGIFFLEVIDSVNGCTAIDALEIMADTLAPRIQLNPRAERTLTCAQDTARLNAGASFSLEGHPLEFIWTTPQDPAFNPVDRPELLTNRAGLYQVRVQDLINGCVDILAVTVDYDTLVPAFQVLPSDPLTCDRSSTQLQVRLPGSLNNFRYQWENSLGDPIAGTNQPAIVAEPGTYRVRVTSLRNGCTDDALLTATLDTLPPVVNIGVEGAIGCERPTVDLVSMDATSDAFTYQWEAIVGSLAEPVDRNRVTALEAGTYRLTLARLRNGCQASGEVTIVENANPIGDIFISSTLPDCQGAATGVLTVDSVQGGTPPFVYALDDDFFLTGNTFTSLLAGSYQIRVQDASGCERSIRVDLPAPTPLAVDLGPDRMIRPGDSVILVPQIVPSNYRELIWEPAGFFSNPDEDVQVVRPSVTTIYRVRVISEEGCISTDAVTIGVDQRAPAFVPNVFSPDGDGTNDLFRIFPGPEFVRVPVFRIFDRWGNQLYQAVDADPDSPNFGWDGRYRGQDQNSGVYVFYAELERRDGTIRRLEGDFVLMR